MRLEFEGVVYEVEVSDEEEKRINADPDYAYSFCLNVKENLGAGVSEEGTDAEFTWTDTNTLLLLEEYRRRKEDFRNSKKKKKELWMQIQNKFTEHKYSVLVDVLDKKFRNIKQTFLRIKDSQNVKKRTGQGSIKWKFYSIMEDIFDVHGDVTAPVEPIESALEPQPKVLRAEQTAQSSASTSARVLEIPFVSPEPQVPQRDETAGETPRRKKRVHKTLQTFRMEQLQAEQDRVMAIKNLQKAIDENTKVMRVLVDIQAKRNKILQELVKKK